MIAFAQPRINSHGMALSPNGMASDPIVSLALELHHLLADLQDARRARAGQTSPKMEQMRQMAERARNYAAELRQNQPTTAEVLAKIAARLELLRAAAGEGKSLKSLALRAGRQYENLAKLVREKATTEGIELPTLKPRNYARNAYHVSSGFLGAGLYTAFPNRTLILWIAGIYTGCMLAMEGARRLHPKINAFMVDKMFGAIARPIEAYRVNSGTWYGLAIFLMVWFFSPLACICGVIALGVGDPAAAIIGRRFGKHKVRSHKSVEGMLGFVVASTVVMFAFLLATPHAELVGTPIWRVLVISLWASIVGAVTEVYCHPIDDNFAIPLTVAGAMGLLA
jgi:dolichol kinase